jgi:cytochrome b561
MKTRNYSPIYRLMHWLIAFCMLFILLTIFLRLTWMNKENVAEIIQSYLSTTDQHLSDEQLIVLAKQIRKPMWQWHIWAGYAMVALYSIRMLLPLFGQMKFSNPLEKGLDTKTKFQFWVYTVFYLFVAASLTTGLIIEFGPKEIKDVVETIHKQSIYYLLAFIVLHFGGILMAEFTSQQGIISRILGGDKYEGINRSNK